MKLPFWLPVAFKTLEYFSPALGATIAADLFTTPGRHATPPWEAELERRGRSHRAGPLHYTEWGPETGPAIVLLHGWEGRGTQMGFFVEPLVARGQRVIALDGPAHGASDDTKSGPYHFAKALRDLQAVVGPFHGAIGHSMGGAAITIALGDGLTLDRAVLLGSPADLVEVRDRYLHWMGCGPRTKVCFHFEMLRRLGLDQRARSLRDIAVTQTLPVLVVHDPDDREVPVVDGRSNAAAYPNGRILEPSAGGHRKMLKDAAVVAAVVEFVAS